MVQTFDILNLAYSIFKCLKYLRSTTLGSKDIEIRKSEFVAKTQLLYTKKSAKICVYWNRRKKAT